MGFFARRRELNDRVVGWAVSDGYPTITSIARATGLSYGAVVTSLDRLIEAERVLRWCTDDGTAVYEPAVGGQISGIPQTIWLCGTHHKVAMWPTQDPKCRWVEYTVVQEG